VGAVCSGQQVRDGLTESTIGIAVSENLAIGRFPCILTKARWPSVLRIEEPFFNSNSTCIIEMAHIDTNLTGAVSRYSKALNPRIERRQAWELSSHSIVRCWPRIFLRQVEPAYIGTGCLHCGSNIALAQPHFQGPPSTNFHQS